MYSLFLFYVIHCLIVHNAYIWARKLHGDHSQNVLEYIVWLKWTNVWNCLYPTLNKDYCIVRFWIHAFMSIKQMELYPCEHFVLFIPFLYSDITFVYAPHVAIVSLDEVWACQLNVDLLPTALPHALDSHSGYSMQHSLLRYLHQTQNLRFPRMANWGLSSPSVLHTLDDSRATSITFASSAIAWFTGCFGSFQPHFRNLLHKLLECW